jgi:hypothetical protein
MSLTPEDRVAIMTDAKMHLAAAEHFLISAEQGNPDAQTATSEYAGSCAHSLLAIGRLLNAGLEDDE